MRSCMGNQKGFTLVELIIALALMAIGILAVVGMQVVALQSNTIANQLSVANELAQEALEDILSWDPGNAAFATSQGSTPYAGFPVQPATSPPTYTTTVTDPNSGSYWANYTTVVGSAGNGIPVGTTGVSVTVTYSYKGISKSVTVGGFKETV